MQVKMLEGGAFSHSSVAEFLNKAVEHPPEVSVANAVRLLQDIGAFKVGAMMPWELPYWSRCKCAAVDLHSVRRASVLCCISRVSGNITFTVLSHLS